MNREEWEQNFRRNLRVKLVQNDISRAQLSEMIGLNRHTVGRYLSGERIPDAYVITLMSEVFNCTTDELIFGDKMVD